MSDRNDIAKLRESLEKCRMMIKHAGNAIFGIDPDTGAIVEANLQAEEMTGFSMGELTKMKVWDLHPDDQRDTAKLLFDRVVTEGTGEECDMSFLRKDGSVVEVDVSATVIRFGEKKIILRICKDVTERRALEDRNEQQRKYYETILNTMPVGLGVRTDLGDTPSVVFENATLETMFHGREEDPEHSHWYTVGMDDPSGDSAFFTGDGYVAVERKQKSGKVLQFRSSYVRDETGSWNEIQVVEDVTERAILREELLQANEDLERKVQERTRELRDKQAQLVQSEKMAALGSLVAGVAHEINTPLGALNSNVDLFIRAFEKFRAIVSNPDLSSQIREDPELRRLLEVVDDLNSVSRTATRRIVTIVDSLRNFARLEEAERKDADIHEGIESTLTLVHHQMKNRIRIVREFGEVPVIRCFPNQLNQVFMNLLVNAAQAIDGEGEIVVSTSHDEKGDQVVVEITDNGRGIEPELLQRIFDPGFTTKGAGVGTGLGLSIVYQIVKDHGGTVGVESEPGKGTTFRVVLPVGH
jgi:PAS domain S-box-containing protein